MEILTLGEKIKRRRKDLNMTLKELAGERITPGQISLVESGKSNPSMDLLEYLAITLQTSVEYLMESEESQAEKICKYYKQMAENYILNNDYDKAEIYIEEAITYANKYGLEHSKAKVLYLRANICQLRNELVLAQQLYLAANVIFIKNNSFEQIIKTLLNLGKITLILKAFNSSTSYLRRAEQVYLENNIGNDDLLGKIYYQMAEVYFKIDNLEKSNHYAILAKEKFDEVKNREEYGRMLLSLAHKYNNEADLANAITYSSKALEVYREIKEEKITSDIENNLGRLFYEFGDVNEAFKHYEFAKEIRLKREENSVIDTLINICEGYLKIKELKKCEKVLDEIGELVSEDNIEQIVEQSILWYRLYSIKENYLEAESTLLHAFNLAKDNGLTKRSGELAIMIGQFYVGFKRETEAAEYLDKGVSIFKGLGIINS